MYEYMSKIGNISCIIISCLFLSIYSQKAEANFSGTPQDKNVIRKLLCTANVYGYEEENEQELIPEELKKSVAVRYLEDKVDEYLQALIGSGAGINYVLQDGQKFHVLRIGRVEGQLVGNNLSGLRVGGFFEIALEDEYVKNLLTVTINTNKSAFTEGEDVQFYLEGNLDFHACLIEATPDNKVTQLIPNFFKPSGFFSKGQYLFPNASAGDQFQFVVGGPFGTAAIHLFSSELAIGSIQDDNTSQDYFVESAHSLDTIRQDVIDRLLDEMFSVDPAVSFQCFQLVEHEKSLVFKPVSFSAVPVDENNRNSK